VGRAGRTGRTAALFGAKDAHLCAFQTGHGASTVVRACLPPGATDTSRLPCCVLSWRRYRRAGRRMRWRRASDGGAALGRAAHTAAGYRHCRKSRVALHARLGDGGKTSARCGRLLPGCAAPVRRADWLCGERRRRGVAALLRCFAWRPARLHSAALILQRANFLQNVARSAITAGQAAYILCCLLPSRCLCEERQRAGRDGAAGTPTLRMPRARHCFMRYHQRRAWLLDAEAAPVAVWRASSCISMISNST